MVLRADRISDPYSNARWLCRLRGEGLLSLLLVSTAGGHEFLEEQGIVSTFVPLALLPGDGRDLGLERDVDVLFLGSQDVPRRRRLIGWLRRRGVPIVAVGDWGEATGYWGERRTELLNRTKILLNLPRHGGLLSGRRMILGMANKALLVAEPIYRPEPYQAGVHFVSSELADMPEVIAAYLDDFKARDKIAAAGHDFVRNHLTLEPTVERILTLVADRSRDDAR